MVASNRASQDWYSLLPNPVLAEAELGRLINCSQHLILARRRSRPLLSSRRASPLAKGNEQEEAQSNPHTKDGCVACPWGGWIPWLLTASSEQTSTINSAQQHSRSGRYGLAVQPLS